ncbi:fasciclin domain-containing protein [Anabaena azotica]|uniref:Fasciclin domain-containing protein n=1 Tax=Anabaena azotica FACHB-119 TaxID=947527 RepID=A0ABR8D3S9_9NOST|nr:fasciclin domain-containing protein [Anabaena azotica]MBD2501810.1 fasciclin domain-containing protein [Anabaena azotica FACHB-119]
MANIVETAVNAGKFKNLVQAAQAAQILDVLKGNEIFTLFAPSDEAFAKLPEGTLDSLLQDIPKLKKILTYHVAYGDVRSDDLVQIEEAETLEGSVVAIESQDVDTLRPISAEILHS